VNSGLVLKRRAQNDCKDNLEAILVALTILSLEPPVAEYYAAIRTELERSGNLIGPNDLLIAAHTLAEGRTLVTDNVREFSRVPNLNLENWLSSGN
jgi:tRNA(fMet)-specific endonuclease VapC